MSLLRRTRTEVAGAWRSLRYDLGRTPAEPPAGGPDVTYTGMGTFGGLGTAEPYAEPAPGPAAVPTHRRPRRAAAVTAFGTLTVLGAAGAYLAVVNGLGSVLSETPAAADTFPARPAVTTDAGLGTGPTVSGPAARPPARGTATRPQPATPVGKVTVAPPGTAVPPSVPSTVAPPPTVRPVRTTKAAKPECHCDQPPVPTPAAPSSSPSPTPSDTPSTPESPLPSPSEPSATPSESVAPSESPQGRQHRRHHR